MLKIELNKNVPRVRVIKDEGNSDPRDIAKPHGFDLTVLKRHLRPSNLGQSGAGTVAGEFQAKKRRAI